MSLEADSYSLLQSESDQEDHRRELSLRRLIWHCWREYTLGNQKVEARLEHLAYIPEVRFPCLLIGKEAAVGYW